MYVHTRKKIVTEPKNESLSYNCSVNMNRARNYRIWHKKSGYEVVSGQRSTGDGYYESCIVAVEQNQIVYLKDVVSESNIEIGDYTIYNDFVNAPCDFKKNNVLYHYPVNGDKLKIGKFPKYSYVKNCNQDDPEERILPKTPFGTTPNLVSCKRRRSDFSRMLFFL